MGLTYQEQRKRNTGSRERSAGAEANGARARQAGAVAALLLDLAYLASQYQKNGELSLQELWGGGAVALITVVYLVVWNGIFARQSESLQEKYHKEM